MTKKERSHLLKEMIQIARGLDSDAQIELRGFNHHVGRHNLMNYALGVYRETPVKFHNENSGKFVAARLIEVALQRREENCELESRLPIFSEKSLKKAIGRALKLSKIPRHLRQTSFC